MKITRKQATLTDEEQKTVDDGLVRITRSSGESTKELTDKQRWKENRSVGSAIQRTCFVCKNYGEYENYSSFCCKWHGTALCKVDRSDMGGDREICCMVEHLTGDGITHCNGKQRIRYKREWRYDRTVEDSSSDSSDEDDDV